MKFISAGSQDNENQKELIIKKLSKFIARYKKKKKNCFCFVFNDINFHQS